VTDHALAGRLQIGIDVGGTFTDLVAVGDGLVHRAKVLTSPDDPLRAIMNGVEVLLAQAGCAPADVGRVVHGTTLAGNALVERTGVPVGLLTTRGHQDILEMGNELRYDLYDLTIRRAVPLVPRVWRVPITERLDADGAVLIPLNQEEVLDAVTRLRSEGIEALAICFLHSYKNPAHERRATALVAERFPDLPITYSSAVAPEMREYERFSTAAANAYIQPIIDRYLGAFEERLRESQVRGRLWIMTSSGGIAPVDDARRFPIRLVESGPAGGILAAAKVAQEAEIQSALAFDMGGTTAKISIVEEYTPKIVHAIEVARVHRFKKGSGLPLRIPVVDMIEIGAGGGSIASIDRMGLLKVGPRSAGAVPGPAAYGRGGTEPTVTDADLLLGMLNHSYFLGGDLRLDVERAHRAIDEHIAQPLGIDATAAALGIHAIVNETMAQAARGHLAERGVDPRKFTLVASGGAGPVHAYGLARSLRLRSFVCPAGAGVASALGLLLAPALLNLSRPCGQQLDAIEASDVEHAERDLQETAEERFASMGIAAGDVSVSWSADIRYVGQGFEINVPLERLATSASTLRERFQTEYRARYGRTLERVPAEVITWRFVARGPIPSIKLRPPRPGPNASPVKGTRVVTFPSVGAVKCTVYDRYALAAPAVVPGPAILEERESTVVFGPDARATVDARGNVVVQIEG
jgi:N-methylhydantoinase A